MLCGSTGVDTKGNFRAVVSHRGLLRKRAVAYCALVFTVLLLSLVISILNAGKMKIFGEYLSLAWSLIQSDKDYPNHP